MTQFKNFRAAARKPNLVPFNLMPNGSDLSWIAANYSMPEFGSVTGNADGVNDTFTLGISVSDVLVFVNGLLMQPSVDYVLTPGSGTVVFGSGSIPPNGASVRIAVMA